jgi:transcriptional regulator with XRE-family HTH domain
VKPVGRAVADTSAVEEYKRILQQVLENRPAGTRRRLAEALGKNRSFISQITNPAYSVPIPAPHLETIFEICHFLAAEKSRFLANYARAHPKRAPANHAEPRWRELVLRVPDLRAREKNKVLDELLKETVQKVARLIDQ